LRLLLWRFAEVKAVLVHRLPCPDALIECKLYLGAFPFQQQCPTMRCGLIKINVRALRTPNQQRS